jgi:hypothetical protein
MAEARAFHKKMLRWQGIKENAKTTDNSGAGGSTPDCELLGSPAFLGKLDVYHTLPPMFA